MKNEVRGRPHACQFLSAMKLCLALSYKASAFYTWIRIICSTVPSVISLLQTFVAKYMNKAMVQYVSLCVLCICLVLSACGIEKSAHTHKTVDKVCPTESVTPDTASYDVEGMHDYLNARRKDMPFYDIFSKDVGVFYSEYSGAGSEIHSFGNNIDIAIPRSESIYFWRGGEDAAPSEAAFELLIILLDDIARVSAHGKDYFYCLTDFSIGIQTPLDWEDLISRELDIILPLSNNSDIIDDMLEDLIPRLLPLGENMWVFTPAFSYEYSGVAELHKSNGEPASFQGVDKYIMMCADGVWRLQSLSSLVKMYGNLKPNMPLLGEPGQIPDNIRLPDNLSVKSGEHGELLLQNANGMTCGCGAALKAGNTEFENGKIVSLSPLTNHSLYTTPLVSVEGGAVVRIEFDVYDRGAYLPVNDVYWCIVAQEDDSSPSYVRLLSVDEFTLSEALNVLAVD